MSSTALTTPIPQSDKPLTLNVYQDRDADRKRVVDMLEGVVDWADSAECTITQWKQGRHKDGRLRIIQEQRQAKKHAGNYFRKRLNAVALCGRTAVGVSLFPGIGSVGKSAKVHHTQCRDRLCPICNAIQAAHTKPIVAELIKNEFLSGSRLFFNTLTVPHQKNDDWLQTKKLLDRTWGLFTKRELIKEIFCERVRVAELEVTEANGGHPHFHVIWKLDKTSRANYWKRNYMERMVKEEWIDCCFKIAAKMGLKIGAAHQVNLQEMRQCPKNLLTDKEREDDTPRILRWIPPRDYDKRRAQAIKQGHRLLSINKQWWTVQPISKAVDELTKYITKRHSLDKNGQAKKGQIGFWDYSSEQLYKYMMTVRGWNLYRCSKGWDQIEKAAKEALQAEKEIKAALKGGAEFFPWARIVTDSKAAVREAHNGKFDLKYINTYKRILEALEKEGCDIAATMLRPWFCRAAGELGKRLPDLEATSWQLTAYAKALEAQEVEHRRVHYMDNFKQRLRDKKTQQLLFD